MKILDAAMDMDQLYCVSESRKLLSTLDDAMNRNDPDSASFNDSLLVIRSLSSVTMRSDDDDA